MPQRELLKIVSVAVVLERDKKGAITGEQKSVEVPCYSRDELVAYYDKIVAALDNLNAEQENNT